MAQRSPPKKKGSKAALKTLRMVGKTSRPRAAKAKRPASPKRRAAAAPEQLHQADDGHFLVVGLGASAGGLEAVRKLLAVLPAKTGFAFVLIQHLDPSHESLMAELLARDTAMKVVQVRDGMPLEPNCLHVIPPNAYLGLDDGMFRISEPPSGARMPIDFFLKSLARNYGERAVAIILSGTGSDGSAGVKAVSESGGLAIAQEPDEASYAGMSRSAIATGVINLMLPVAKIPNALINYAQHAYVRTRRVATEAIKGEEQDEKFQALISLLRQRTSRDFAHYKKPTLLRRTQRRMAVAGIKELDDYIKLLRQDNHELELLAKDLLIHVTGFFRDLPAFVALAKTVIPGLVSQHKDDEPIRVWVPGCSTGEEAYTIAMLFMEEIATAKRGIKLQVFASDVSEDVVAYGRVGLYPDSIKADVSQERIARFFKREHDGYRVSRDLRDSIVFTVQDLLSDPPFSHLDLVSCRNLLIYLEPSEQDKVLRLFHFALRERGYLFLGSAENVGRMTDSFEPIVETLRVFRRVGPLQPRGRAAAPLPINDRSRALWPPRMLAPPAETRQPGLGDLVKAQLLEAYAPASVLVNSKYQGLYFFGPVDRYLRVAAGEPSRDLPAMLRDGLASKFRAVVRQVVQDHKPATIHGGQIRRNGDTVDVIISAWPLHHQGQGLVVVTFSEGRERAAPPTETPAETSRSKQLEQELDTTRRELEATISDLQASNQELTSLNEEAISMNEEFQSTNEELESSREELQSLNEELTTVNSQLQESLDRERKSSDDLKNILNSSDIATLFLDRDLNIRYFTPAAAPLFNLISTDLGRPLTDLAVRFEGVDLAADTRAVLASLKPIRRDIRSASGTWYLCGVSPYRTQADRIEGAVINLADISIIKAGEEGLRRAHVYTEAIIDTVREPLVVVDEQLRVVSASRSFYRFFGASPEDTLGRLLPDTDAHHLDVAKLREFLERARGGQGSESFELELDLPPLGRRTLTVVTEEIHDANMAEKRNLISFTDITEFKRSAEQLDAAKRAAEHANLEKSRFLAAASHDLRQPLQALTLLHGRLEQRARDEQDRDLLNRMRRILDSMNGLVTGLLDINQLEAGAIRPVWTDFPVMEVLGALDSEFSDQAKTKGLDWRLVHCGVTVRSDRRLLAEITRNLVSNAIRYTDQGKILVGCRRRGSSLLIEVWDTGIGIAEEQLPRIFEDYYQIAYDAHRTGLGLGLAIVKRLGELLRHPIGGRSGIGKGSLFSIEVPRAGAMPPPAERAEEPQRAKTGRTGTILVIEDEPTVREMVAATLAAEGHRVTAVSNGQPALDLLAKNGFRPDLVISDYGLPGKFTGAEIAATLRTTLGRQVPAIILTGDARAETQRDIQGKGLSLILKPVDATTLSRLTGQLLAGLPQAAATPISVPATERPPAANAATIFVVDDNRDIREAMHTVLTQAGYDVRTSADAQSFLSSHQPADRGCVIVDVRMPGMNGIEMLVRLAAMGSKLPAIVITGQGDIAMAVEAMRAGAVDFIEKPFDPETLLASIERALRQTASPGERSAGQAAAALRIVNLTKREREVMDLVVAGHLNKEIAARLGINQRTVETHRATVMRKMGASSLSELVRQEMLARGGP